MKINLLSSYPSSSLRQKYVKSIDQIEYLFADEYKFVVDPDGNVYEDSIQQYGEENVYEIRGLSKEDVGTFTLIKLRAYEKVSPLSDNSDVRLIFHNIDLNNLKDKDIINFLGELFFDVFDVEEKTLPKPAGSLLPIKKTHFLNCCFSNIEKAEYFDPDTFHDKRIFFNSCLINKIIINGHSPRNYSENIENSYIKNLSQNNRDLLEFVFSGTNHIDILTTSAKKIDLRNISIKLYQHKFLDDATIYTDNVTINFDWKIFKNISKVPYHSFLNTFTYIRELKSFVSHKMEIEKYINYFNSRSNPIKSGLFWFNVGYTRILIPFVFLLVFSLLNFAILYYSLNIISDSMVYIFYPIDLFKHVVLKDFSFENDISCAKIFITFFEILIIYSGISFGIALKKLLGFKITN